MALGKYSRVDNNNNNNNRKSSSSYCSTVTIVAFVGLCLVGIWMLTSSSVVPVQTGNGSAEEKKNQVEDQVTPVTSDNNDSSNTSDFEDNRGDLPDDATKGDANVSLAENDGKGNLNTQENKDNTEETKMVESKKDDEQSASEGGEKSGDNSGGQGDSLENSDDKKSDSDENDKKSEENNEKSDLDDGDKKQDESSSETNGDQADNQIEEKVDQNDNKELEKSSDEPKDDGQLKNQSSNEVFPSGAQSELLNETVTQTGSFSTQATESKIEKETQLSSKKYSWKLCNSTAGPDYIPCLDNLEAIRHLPSTKHYEHRERHCPEEPPTCLVPLPEGYKRRIEWPKSREKIWYYNVPHTKLAQIKGHQNWVKVTGEYLTFPGGGTQFKHGALHYIDFIEE
ncbi:hypothetical protein Godav_006114, partial [Gossypium davidsonii]|nr:hypothetical protein [Gossypium davidsonii]